MSLVKNHAQLPISPPPQLFGRDSLLQMIQSLLSPDQALCLYGLAGVGKRALAASLAAYWLQARGSVLWLDVGWDDPRALIGGVLRAYAVHSQSKPAEMVRGLLGQQRPLIILSGALSHNTAASFIRQFSAGHAPTISIHQTAIDGPWEPLLVRRLDAEASRAYLTSLAPNQSSADLENILAYADGQPLALNLIGRTVAVGAADWTEFYETLPSSSDDLSTRSNAIIEAAFNQLDNTSQGLLMAMGAGFSDGLSGGLLQQAVGGNLPPNVWRALLKRGFVTASPQTNYYRTHPLIRAFARQRLNTHNTLPEAEARMLGAVHSYLNLLDQSLERVSLEMPNILGATFHCLHNGRAVPLQAILEGLRRFEEVGLERAFWQEIDYLHEQAANFAAPYQPSANKPEAIEGVYTDTAALESLELEDAPTDPHPPPAPPVQNEKQAADTTSRALVPIAQSANPRQLTTAYQGLQAAYEAASARADRPRMAELARQMALSAAAHHDPATALGHYDQTTRLYQELGDLRSLLAVLEEVSDHTLRHFGGERAAPYVQQGLNIARQLGDDATRCRLIITLGDLRTRTGDHSGADEAYKRAIKLGRGLGDPELAGIALGKLAALYLDNQRYREALQALSQAISLFSQSGRRDLLGRSLGNLGTALGHMGRWREAGQRHSAAMHIARELGDSEEERFQLQNLAYVAEADNNPEWALRYNRQALYLALLQRDQRAIGELAYEIGRLLFDAEDAFIGQTVVLLEAAQTHYSQAEAETLLHRARIKLAKHQRAGRYLSPAETDLLSYAASAYPEKERD